MSDALISWSDFEKVDIRSGTIIEVNDFPKQESLRTSLSLTLGHWVSKIICAVNAPLSKRSADQ